MTKNKAWESRDIVRLDLWDDGFSEWAMMGAIVRPDGIYLCTDDGCSCAVPFQHYSQEDLGDFTGPLSVEQFATEARSLWERQPGAGRCSEPCLVEFIDTVSSGGIGA